MSQKIDIEELKRENGFNVPSNYFDSLEVNIQERIKAKKNESFLYRFRYPSIAFAISFIAYSLWLMNAKDQTQVTITAQPVDYVSYVNENIEEFDDDLVYETYTPAASKEISIPELNDFKNTEALDEYLLDEGVDEEVLLDEL